MCMSIEEGKTKIPRILGKKVCAKIKVLTHTFYIGKRCLIINSVGINYLTYFIYAFSIPLFSFPSEYLTFSDRTLEVSEKAITIIFAVIY